MISRKSLGIPLLLNLLFSLKPPIDRIIGEIYVLLFIKSVGMKEGSQTNSTRRVQDHYKMLKMAYAMKASIKAVPTREISLLLTSPLQQHLGISAASTQTWPDFPSTGFGSSWKDRNLPQSSLNNSDDRTAWRIGERHDIVTTVSCNQISTSIAGNSPYLVRAKWPQTTTAKPRCEE